jgi:sarcosine oxidase subunit beta
MGSQSRPDAVIVGAGVIGAAIAFELAKRGYKTLSLDKLPAAGYGPTSNSCSIVRAHYSSWDGVAMAFEGFSYWHDWPNYLEVEDERGTAKYMNCGTLLLKSEHGHHEKVLPNYDAIGIPYEEWTVDETRERAPFYDLHAFWPPRRPEDAAFWDPPERELEGAIYTPGSGYVNDPQLATHNLQRAAEARGAEFRFSTEIRDVLRSNGKVSGVLLSGGETIEAPIVVNVAGPHSFVINRMAGVEESMLIKTRALRHEVHVVPAPPDVDYEQEGFHVSDGDQAIYFRPESASPTRRAGSSTSTTSPTTGSRSTTSPTWTASTWPSAPAATSSRTPPSLGT